MNRNIGNWILLSAVLVIQNIPIIWLFNTAIRPEHGFLVLNDFRFSEGVTLDNFYRLLIGTNFMRWFGNSLIIATASALLAAILGNIFCLGIRFSPNKGPQRLRDIIFLAYILPAMFLILPVQWMLSQLSTDILSILFLPLIYQLFLFPVSTWIASGYIDRIPEGAVQMARLDDLTMSDRVRLVHVPYASAGFWIAFAITFVIALQEFVYAFILVIPSRAQTLTVGIAEMQAGDIYQWAIIAAAGVAVVILMLVMLFIFRVAVKAAVTRLGVPLR